MMKDTPTEDEIGTLLERVQPQPGANLRARVAQAPWNAPEARATPKQRRTAWFPQGAMRRFGFAALAVIAVLIGFFTIPPFNGIAQRFAQFFYHSDQDTINLSLTPQAPSQQFPLTLAEAATEAGFAATQPDWVPVGFQLNGAAYEPNRKAVLLDYHSPIPGKFLRVTEIQVEPGRINVSNIGASAEVQAVDIQMPSGKIVPGEYVVGAWRIPTMLDHLQTDQPDMTATMQVSWNANAKIHMLRWETDGVLYEILHGDQTLESLSAEMLVKIAESMK